MPLDQNIIQILEELHYHEPLGFNDVFSAIGGNRNQIQKRLTQLGKEGLIHEGQTKLKHGRKKAFRLTAKGKYQLSLASGENVCASLKQFLDILREINNPKDLADLREMFHEPMIKEVEFEALKNDTLTLTKAMNRFKKRVGESSGLLTNSLQNLHEIFFKTCVKEEFQKGYGVGFSEEGYVVLTPLKTHKEKRGP